MRGGQVSLFCYSYTYSDLMECGTQTSFSAQQMTGCSPGDSVLSTVCQRKYGERMLGSFCTAPSSVYWVFSDAMENSAGALLFCQAMSPS